MISLVGCGPRAHPHRHGPQAAIVRRSSGRPPSTSRRSSSVAPLRRSEAMLICSMSVSVDGFIADREGAFGWTTPNEEQFRFHLALIRELGGYLCGCRLYETML